MSSTSQKLQIPEEIVFKLDLLPTTQRVDLTDNHFTRKIVSGSGSQLFDHQDQGNNATSSNSDPVLDSFSSLNLGDMAARLTFTERVARGSLGTIYRASIDAADGLKRKAPSVVVKLVIGEEKIHSLRHEATMYQHAKALQNQVLPFFFGFYENDPKSAACIVLEDCGHPFEDSFENLGEDVKLSILQALKRLHEAGIEHGDLQPWNVLDHDASPRIVDLHLAMNHKCPSKNQVMTQEFCSQEAVAELLCHELSALGGRMRFRSEDAILYGEDVS